MHTALLNVAKSKRYSYPSFFMREPEKEHMKILSVEKTLKIIDLVASNDETLLIHMQYELLNRM